MMDISEASELIRELKRDRRIYRAIAIRLAAKSFPSSPHAIPRDLQAEKIVDAEFKRLKEEGKS